MAHIASISSTLPSCSPNLMPFHIKHTGIAPIATYMIVNPSPSPVGASDDNNNSDSAPPQLEVHDSDAATQPTNPNSPWTRVARHAARFISAFRGRTIHGLRVDVPTGYVGIVLRPTGISGSGNTFDPPPSPKKFARKRQTRAGGRAIHEMDQEPDEVTAADENPEGTLARTLKPTHQFSSFVLWHPDNPVDEGKDEYFRSLTEWTKLASIIHNVESE